MYMDEFKIPIGCNIFSTRESFGYNYRLMKYVIKPHVTSSLFQNNNINHCVVIVLLITIRINFHNGYAIQFK